MIDLGSFLLHIGASDKSLVVPGHSWRRFFLLLGMFFAALVLADLLPIGGRSDVRSKWLNKVAEAVVCIGFLITVVWTYWKGGALTGLQTIMLCTIFGFTLICTAQQLYSDVLFRREVRGRHGSGGVRVPNPRSAADAGLGFHLRFGQQWSGAADSARYRDVELHSILLGWSDPDQALRVAAGILGKRASGGRWPSGHYCQRCGAFPTMHRTWKPQSGVELELGDRVKTK